MNEQKRMKSLLEKELSVIKFNQQEEVLKRTHPKTLTQNCGRWLNKEISIPVIPATSVAALLLAAGIFTVVETGPETHQIVEFAGNLYYQHVLEEKGVTYEH